jgi:hypothetical protein
MIKLAHELHTLRSCQQPTIHPVNQTETEGRIMIRISHAAILMAVSILGAASAHAEILNVTMTADDAMNSSFSLSFDLNTAATTNTIGLGGCDVFNQCVAPDIYTAFSATGGISNALLTWKGVNYSLTSSNIFLDWQGGSAFDLDMHLGFNNAALTIDDNPTGGPYSSLQYNPSQMLTAAMLTSYNGLVDTGHFEAGAGGSLGNFLDGLIVKTTPVTSVPEPDTLALLSVSLAGVVALSLSRRRMVGKTGK